MVTVANRCLVSYHAADDGQGADVLPLGREHITVVEIPPDAHVGGNVFSGVDGVISGALAMNGGLGRERERSLTSSLLSSSPSQL